MESFTCFLDIGLLRWKVKWGTNSLTSFKILVPSPAFHLFGTFESLSAPQFVWFTPFFLFSFFIFFFVYFILNFGKEWLHPLFSQHITFCHLPMLLILVHYDCNCGKILFSVMFMWIFHLRLNLGQFLSILLNSE